MKILRTALTLPLLCISCYFEPLFAASIENFDSPVSDMAVDQPVGIYLEELFFAIDTPVVVDERVKGNITDKVSTPSSVAERFKSVAKSFELALYYDGSIAHIYQASDVSSTNLWVSRKIAERVTSIAARLDLFDSINNLSYSRDELIVSGYPRFLEQISELADALHHKPRLYTPPIVSQTFQLKKAKPTDSLQVINGRQRIVPGVVSQLDGPMLNIQSLQNNEIGQQNGNGAWHLLDSLSDDVIRFKADVFNNAVIIKDQANTIASHIALIEPLDVEQRMIDINTTTVDINVDRLRELGVNWQLKKRENEDQETWENMLLLAGQPGIQEDTDRVVLQILHDKNKFMSRIHTLESQGAARIVSTSQVSTTQNIATTLLIPPFNMSEHTIVLSNEGKVAIVFSKSEGITLQVTPQVREQHGRSMIALSTVHQKNSIAADHQLSFITSSFSTSASIHGDGALIVGGSAIIQRSTAAEPGIHNNKPNLIAHTDNSEANSETNSEHIERIFLISPEIKP